MHARTARTWRNELTNLVPVAGARLGKVGPQLTASVDVHAARLAAEALVPHLPTTHTKKRTKVKGACKVRQTRPHRLYWILCLGPNGEIQTPLLENRPRSKALIGITATGKRRRKTIDVLLTIPRLFSSISMHSSATLSFYDVTPAKPKVGLDIFPILQFLSQHPLIVNHGYQTLALSPPPPPPPPTVARSRLTPRRSLSQISHHAGAG